MISSDKDNSHKYCQSNCIKCEEYKSRLQQLELDVIEKEDECMFWYRQFEDVKEEDNLSVLPTHGSVDVVI